MEDHLVEICFGKDTAVALYPPHNPAMDCLHQLNREILHLFQVYAGKPCKGCGFPGICQAAGENQYL